MHRIALVLASVGIIGSSIAAAVPAQAHEGRWGGQARYERVRHHDWCEHEWHEHHGWRAAYVEGHRSPWVFFGRFHR